MPPLLHPPLPPPRARQRWHQLYGSARSLAIAEGVESDQRPYLVIARDARELDQLRAELGFFLGDAARIHVLPDWEVLPYDVFSPHPDIISERLAALAELPRLKSGVVLAAADTLGQRLAPRGYVAGRTFNLSIGDRLPLEPLRARLVESGYASVSQVTAPGEFALRGSLFDVFPMGARTPLRIDLFDDEIEAIREFDPDSQRSGASLKQVRMLPGRELPLDADSVKAFRLRYRKRFEGDPTRSVIYRGVSDGIAPPGIEFYLPLIFETTETLLD
jgi:transcription-repair coupling factor (superfamily II helicase)